MQTTTSRLPVLALAALLAMAAAGAWAQGSTPLPDTHEMIEALKPSTTRSLRNLVAAMLSPELKGVRFAIEGHSDARGQAAANRQLSQDRAEQVRLYLIALGVHPGRLKAVGKGASDLANPLDPGAPANRRVRVVTLE